MYIDYPLEPFDVVFSVVTAVVYVQYLLEPFDVLVRFFVCRVYYVNKCAYPLIHTAVHRIQSGSPMMPNVGEKQ